MSPTLPIHLEDRDLAILGAVAEHRFLTQELLLLLFPPDAARTPLKAITAALEKRAADTGRIAEFSGKYVGSNLGKRLRLLSRAGLLVRVARGLKPGTRVMKPSAYALTAAGQKVLVASERLRRPVHATGPAEKLYFVEHTLMIARFRIGLALAVGERASLELVESQREHQQLRFRWQDIEGQHRVCPDGFLVIVDHSAPEGRNARAAFLECDRGTMNGEDLLRKFEDYARFEASGRLEKLLGIASARIVTVAKDATRASRLLTIAAETESHALENYRDRFLFTSEDAYRDAPTNVLAQIWRAADRPTERASIIPSPIALRHSHSQKEKP